MGKKRARREQRKAERQAAAAAEAAHEAERREQFRAEIRSQRCPLCSSDAVARLLYGLPRFDAELQADLDAGLVALAGCSFADDDPVWLCRTCRHEWGRLISERPGEDRPLA